MRRFAFLLLIALLGFLPAADLSFSAAEGIRPELVEEVGRLLTKTTLPLLAKDQYLDAVLQYGEEENQLVLSVSFEGTTIHLPFRDDTQLLSRYLVQALSSELYPLLSFSSDLVLRYPYAGGFAAALGIEPIREGARFWVLDGQGKRYAGVVATAVDIEKGRVIFAQESGKLLLSGLSLAKKGNLDCKLSLQLDRTLKKGVNLSLSYPLPSYPFRAHVQLGLLEGPFVHGELGLSSSLPFSKLFGTSSALARSLSLEAAAFLGLGYAVQLEKLAAVAQGSVSLYYKSGSWAWSVEVGNRLSVTRDSLLSRGLFFGVGTAYTYTP